MTAPAKLNAWDITPPDFDVPYRFRRYRQRSRHVSDSAARAGKVVKFMAVGILLILALAFFRFIGIIRSPDDNNSFRYRLENNLPTPP